ncbi:phosphoribosyltransferase [Halocatena pleomorpha]|uniref:Phosphoribosyltransferase n=1 Tax=Halocatena pleomorpha TaxID=1785090 RepID=A0A3P3R6F3_9EURY|nr:phosphoribosyltransferase family protein [Halocatena pleomorpha]RRJ28964.1 phosphoribosyltransferase [Halocatena pleomorpha]
MSFADRTEAGHRLGTELTERGVGGDIVLAIPRGGLPLGRAVADTLDLPLDIVVAKKIGAPHNPEYAIGAVASDGSVWLNEDAIETLDIDTAYLDGERTEMATAAREKEQRYRGDREPPTIEGKTVLIVDDGIATGATVRACIERLTNAGTDRVVLAVPVGSPQTIDALRSMVDTVVCLETPPNFRAVGQFYDRFDQVQDEQAMTYLNRS